MNILFLAHRIPYPPDKGDKIRSFNEIRYLSRNNNIYLGTTLDLKSDRKHITALNQYCDEIHAIYFWKKIRLFINCFCRCPFSVAYFYNKSLQNYVDKTLNEKKIDTIICFCSTMAEYIFRTPKFRNKELGNVKLIIDYVDLDSDKWFQYAKYSKFPRNLLYKAENRRLSRYEIKVEQAFHHSVFVSKRELDVFQKLCPDTNKITVISNGVDYEYFKPSIKTVSEKRAPALVFTGIMDYFANEDGVTWFCEKIFNKIKAEIPGVQFYIVGNRPTKAVKKLQKKYGVIVTGFVSDIREYYWLADVCVVPLRIARGLQNKVLEAMATGNAVVSTSNAINGIVAHNNLDVIVEDNEELFAKRVIELLRDESKRKELGENAVKNIHKNYSWKENLKAFDLLLTNK